MPPADRMMPPHGWRLVLTIGLAAAIAHALCQTLGYGSSPTAYGVVIACLVVRPDFRNWPLPIYPVLVILMGISLMIGVTVLGLFGAASGDVWLFAITTTVAQLFGLLLPGKLAMLQNIPPVAAVLPLLSNTTDLSTIGQELVAISLGLVVGTLVQRGLAPVLPPESEPEAAAIAPPPLAERLLNPRFWRKLLVAVLALAIGEGLGTATPKYLYFGVVLLLNDTVGATISRCRDRVIGVSIGVLMPWLVFNTFDLSVVSLGLAMAGTTALCSLLGQQTHLRTALISSGVTFAGYGPLLNWYIPNRWLDYSLGSALALLTSLVLAPDWALPRLLAHVRQLRAALRLPIEPDSLEAQWRHLQAIASDAREEARWLGRRRQLQRLLSRLEQRRQQAKQPPL